ncbi:hypothetical protein [Nitrosomonas communis]|uniref:hypothetical protein n=1 Tax=Nitrosomonas communis TaxID=44574 RepID=UPI0011151F96|nr:hypothetical protein [Nitrosomonas communis]
MEPRLDELPEPLDLSPVEPPYEPPMVPVDESGVPPREPLLEEPPVEPLREESPVELLDEPPVEALDCLLELP